MGVGPMCVCSSESDDRLVERIDDYRQELVDVEDHIRHRQRRADRLRVEIGEIEAELVRRRSC